MRLAMSEDGEYLSMIEIAAVFARLRPADIVRLTAIARNWARACPRRDPMDLLNEGIERSLSGKRSWPADVGLMPFMSQVMRSIASQWRMEDQREPVGLDDEAVSDLVGPAFDIEMKDLVDRMRAFLADDHDALGVLEQQLLQTDRAEAQSRLGLSATAYDTSRRRMIRTLRSQFFLGWNP